MEIRTFRTEDMGSIVDLWTLCLQEHKSDNGWYVRELSLSEHRLTSITTDQNFDPEGAFVVLEDGQTIGFGLAVVKRVASHDEEDLESLSGYLEGLIVHPSYRNRGIGTQLLQHLEKHVRACGKSSIRISRYRPVVSHISVLHNVPAAAFLLNRGFKSEQHELKLRLSFEAFSLRDDIVADKTRLEQEGIEITRCR